MLSIAHEAEQHINAHEAEFCADGTRVCRDMEPEQATPTIRELYEKERYYILYYFAYVAVHTDSLPG